MSESEPNLLYSDIEQELRAGVRELLAARCPWQSVLGRVENDAAEVTDLALWRELAAMGVAGLPIAEELGGAGATWRESSMVAEELGRAVAPVPFLGSAVLAASALTAVDADEEVRSLVSDLAEGRRTATLAVPLSTAPGSAFPALVRAGDRTLTGTVPGVVDALNADVLVVPAVGADGPGLHLVAAEETVRTPVVSLDLTRPLTEVRLAGAPAVAVASGDRAVGAVESALVAGAALLSAEQLGVAEWALRTTVDHLKERTQFGRPLGSFQALKHRLADLWVSISQARAVVRNAAGAVASGSPDAPLAAALAQAFVSGVAVTAAEEAVQMHGGIGFTWEHPVHLYLKRAKSASIALGTADRHRGRIAELVDLPPAP
ncbi:acyl-CoA/acyl-ACP dehydrogenase [Thermobifida halotolerans]|uniref:Acyl-CoA/acyl-ACP dehydrogenase n=1 Tax=Thermobifida halotolerans TaxID=483545 RepID=A0A399FW60_9ACTN|nr:acyl-CoA dehydrogenase family protein [Thermobifida halotolerans]UOE18027.1 acyl-CoA/acyl-ACP dehydrogenase [Thermobifida halotolerans]